MPGVHPEATVGQFVIVHVGFANTSVDEREALRTLDRVCPAEDRETR
ncbi:HypC/HybG/HupF family hydrogenase formation chaperone [Streptomyces olivoreticuli]